MSPRDPTGADRRPWSWLVGGIALLFLLVIALAMWSEREDARRMPEEVDRRGEQPYAPEPVDSPAVR